MVTPCVHSGRGAPTAGPLVSKLLVFNVMREPPSTARRLGNPAHCVRPTLHLYRTELNTSGLPAVEP